MGMEFFIMLMGRNIKGIGRIIWNRDILFIPIKMVEHS